MSIARPLTETLRIDRSLHRMSLVESGNRIGKENLDANPFVTNDYAKPFASTQLTDDDRLSARVHEAAERIDVDAPDRRRASPSAMRRR